MSTSEYHQSGEYQKTHVSQDSVVESGPVYNYNNVEEHHRFREQRIQQYQSTNMPNRTTYVVIVNEANEDNLIETGGQGLGFTSFQDETSRLMFVRKVLATVGIQLLAFACFTYLCIKNDTLNQFLKTDMGQTLTCICLMSWIILFFSITCCRVGRGPPNLMNISLLIVSTALVSMFTAGTVIHYEVPAILLTATTCIGVVIILMLITFFAKMDITNKILYIFGAICALLLFSCLASLFFLSGMISWGGYTWLHLLISCLFAVLFPVIILYQLKLIFGGGVFQYEEDDWLIASLTLFFIILSFFLQALAISRMCSK